MRFVCAVALATILACGNPKASEKDTATETATETEPSAATDTAAGTDTAGTPDADPSPFTFANTDVKEWKGTGDDVVQGVSLKAGGVVFHVVNTGDGYFSAKLIDGSAKDVELLASEVDANDQQAFASVAKDGTYILEIRADADWTISTVKPDVADAIPAKLDGKASTVSKVFPLKADKLMTLKARSGDGYFSIKLLDASTAKLADLLVSATEPYSGEAAMSVDKDGYYMLDINADDAWSIEIH